MQIKRGTTRITILTKKYAFKIPILNRTLKDFIKGWLGNIDERNIWRQTKDKRLCPVYVSFFGLINVMPVVSKNEDIEFNSHIIDYIYYHFDGLPIYIDICSGWKNFGYLNGILVITDYAHNRESGINCSDCDNNCLLQKYNEI